MKTKRIKRPIKSTKPIYITFRSVQKAVIKPSDNDQFAIISREAAHICKQTSDTREWHENFDRFLLDIRDWCYYYADQIDKVYVTTGDLTLKIFVLTKKKTYNFEFDNELSYFDISLAKEFSWLSADVIQLTKNTREDQISSGKAILVYKDEYR